MTEEKSYGRMAAEALDLRLREQESHEREDRMSRLLAERSDLSAAPTPSPCGDPYAVEQLKRQVQMLSEFQRAVLHSKGWRALQMLRRPFGRSW